MNIWQFLALFCFGTYRNFDRAELARAAAEPMPRVWLIYMVAYCAFVFGVDYLGGKLSGMLLLMRVCSDVLVAAAVIWAVYRVWRRPDIRTGALNLLILILTVFGVAMVLAILTSLLKLPKGALTDAELNQIGAAWTMVMALVVVFSISRTIMVEGRLRELAETDKRLEMQRQMLAAQIQPHFLFNSLASLQQWVNTKDDRAAPLLESLTAYLRATLPMFQKSSISLGEEAQAVRSYLEVMRARLGERLGFEIAVPEALAGVQLPPGILLTLTENAVEHGITPALRGGTISLSAHQAGERVVVELADTGVGLPAGGVTIPAFADTHPGIKHGGKGGVGLANSRLRLAQAYGAAAELEVLDNPAGQGCVARLSLPASHVSTSPAANVTSGTLPVTST
ncbi:MAG TPA: histidine kinase [Burkholderiaceae bacterium]|nr:histidine kinase [Burkholderiaceae bacterium]